MISKSQIVELLKTNDRAVARALIVLNERQTADEQVSENTKYQNGRGFRPCHAHMGTSMAKFFLKFNRLSDKQIAYWRKTMRDGKMRIEIYAGQLLDVAQQKEQAKKAAMSAGTAIVKNENVPQFADAGQAERYMQHMDVVADREQTRLDELNKFVAKCRMEAQV